MHSRLYSRLCTPYPSMVVKLLFGHALHIHLNNEQQGDWSESIKSGIKVNAWSQSPNQKPLSYQCCNTKATTDRLQLKTHDWLARTNALQCGILWSRKKECGKNWKLKKFRSSTKPGKSKKFRWKNNDANKKDAHMEIGDCGSAASKVQENLKCLKT